MIVVRKPRRDLVPGDVYRLTPDQRGWFTWSDNFPPECWLYPDADVEVQAAGTPEEGHVGVAVSDSQETPTEGREK